MCKGRHRSGCGGSEQAPAHERRTGAQLSPIVQHPPAALEQALQRLGVSRFTVADVERGKLGQAPRRRRFDDDF